MSYRLIEYLKQFIFTGFCLMVAGGISPAMPNAFADVSPITNQEKRMQLQAELNKNIQAESVLQSELRTGYRLASRPHASYLLYQQSLGLEDAIADLQQLRFEKTVLIQKLEAISQPPGFSTNTEGPFQGLTLTAYSGSPMLSFDDGSRFDADRTSSQVSARVGFYRLLTGAFLAVAFFLPLLALYRKKTEVPAGKKMVRVFPIFAVQGKNGTRDLFKLPTNLREPLYPKFGGLAPHISV